MFNNAKRYRASSLQKLNVAYDTLRSVLKKDMFNKLIVFILFHYYEF